MITNEDLTGTERSLKGIMAIIDIFTLGKSAIVSKIGSKFFSKVGIKEAIEANVEIAGVTKEGISTFFSNKYTPDEIVDMHMQANMRKTLVPGSRGLYRGVADNGMTIEMYLYRNSEGCNIPDVITAYPVHVDTLK